MRAYRNGLCEVVAKWRMCRDVIGKGLFGHRSSNQGPNDLSPLCLFELGCPKFTSPFILRKFLSFLMDYFIMSSM